MQKYLSLEQVVLNSHMIFDQILISAKFNSITINICTINYSKRQQSQKRKISFNTKLKIPYNRPRFMLIAEPKIVNMVVNPVQVQIDLDYLVGCRYQYRFKTELGAFSAFFCLIQEKYVPRSISNEVIREIKSIKNQKKSREEEIKKVSSSSSKQISEFFIDRDQSGQKLNEIKNQFAFSEVKSHSNSQQQSSRNKHKTEQNQKVLRENSTEETNILSHQSKSNEKNNKMMKNFHLNGEVMGNSKRDKVYPKNKQKILIQQEN